MIRGIILYYLNITGWSCFPLAAKTTVWGMREKSATMQLGFLSWTSCPQGTK